LGLEAPSKEELEDSIGFNLDRPYAIVTFHPATMSSGGIETQFQQLLNAIDQFNNMLFIFTKANADANGRVINQMIDEYVSKNNNCVGFASLGLRLYLSALKYADIVIGNSSSGLYEAPSYKIPAVDIGDRQKGRIKADSVINCAPVTDDIVRAIKEGLKKDCSNTVNPYQGRRPSQEIVDVIKDFLYNDKIDLKKKFWDLDVQAKM
jgi:GDP/UDP-N,N'-diacetylbacillosamine 2-epimerase (hydrolysing)